MVSRLDRLFILLDTGSNESIRLAAAKQIGEVQRVQPNDLDYLLRRIKEYSSKSLWETRIAAGHAIKFVLEQVDRWPPPAIKQEQHADNEAINRRLTAAKLVEQYVNTEQILRDFDLAKIVSKCPTLLSMNTLEHEEPEQTSSSRATTTRGRGRGGRKASLATGGRKPNKEQLLRQRQLINKELGIAMVDSLNVGVKSTDIISNDDLQADYSADSTDCSDQSTDLKQQDARNALCESISNYEKLRNLLLQSGSIAVSSNRIESQVGDISVGNQWPLSDIAKEYETDLFNASWEIRHGCAISLREIVRSQGRSAGKWAGLSEETNDRLNQLWLVDMALKSICVLGLDRFGDFLFDQVVAPVRENAAQLLGCCVASMTEENSLSVIKILLNMLESTSWETRHGGILGLKYTLSVLNKETVKRTLKFSFDSIFKCLGDMNDDVSAEAAASLVPVKDLLIETIPDKTPNLIRFLWEHLADLDDLTSSTSNIILLLASLITSSSAQLEPSELVKSIPKLWPLLSHASTTVRISALKAMITLIKPQKTSCLHWMPEELITLALRLLFQRSILENMDEVRPYIEEAWTEFMRIDSDETLGEMERLNLLKSTSQYLNYWLCLTMQPSNTPIDRGYQFWLNLRSDGTISDIKPDGEVYIGSCTFNAETLDQQKVQVTKCRFLGTNLLGLLYSNLVAELRESQPFLESSKYISEMFTHYLATKSANQRMYSGWALEAWARHQSLIVQHEPDKLKNTLSAALKNQLNSAIQETTLCYDELATAFTRLQQEARDFVAALLAANIATNLPTSSDRRTIYNLNQIQSMCDLDIKTELNRVASKRQDVSGTTTTTHDVLSSQAFATLSSKKASLSKSYQATRSSQRCLSISTLSSLSWALISWWLLPEKLKLLTDPILDSIECETEMIIQSKSIDYLVKLIDILCRDPEKNRAVIDNILTRLIDTLYANSTLFETNEEGAPSAARKTSTATDEETISIDEHKILLLDNLQRRAVQIRNQSRRQSSVGSNLSLKRSHSITALHDTENETTSQESQKNVNNSTPEAKFNGASLALKRIVQQSAETFPQKLPQLWHLIKVDLRSLIDSYNKLAQHDNQVEITNKLVRNLILLQVIGESLSETIRSELLAIFFDLISLLASSSPLIRHQSSKCIGLICKLMLDKTADTLNSNIMPMLESDNILARCGAIETIALVIDYLHLDLVPMINVLVVKVLRRISDQNDQIRLMATHCFGRLLSLMPLNLEETKLSSVESKSILATDKSSTAFDGEDKFIEQLLDPKKLKNYKIPFETRAELRSYQQEGLNWLAFLNRFNLHGILCDEMGLGKTFMTICIVASDHFIKDDGSNESTCRKQLPSLIVCPSTLVEHWLYEIEKFVPSKMRSILNSVGYAGSLGDRMLIRNRISGTLDRDKSSQSGTKTTTSPINLIVTSYDILRNDVDFFKSIDWNYCVLDEGHIIKNGKTKLSKAIRLLTAKHRLILSGTPIQNNVTELWSLFDFLMPGFLGSERQFNSCYAKRILQSREPKCSNKEREAGALAMESLHRQVLPFILRRLKEDVLDDLPPKIIQDYFCELSPLQSKLYEDFTRSRLCQDVTRKSVHNMDEDGVKSEVRTNSRSHVFQALQYLKNVCNHPKLVLTQKHSQYKEIKKQLDGEGKTLDDINHSSKLRALKQLLIDCGIGIPAQANDEAQPMQATTVELESVVNQHRALVFCQLRSMVDIIENDLLKKHLPNITYLKLDGSVPTNQRQSIVTRFNNDPSIDVLLLTTQIGGLGLNLTGADTVVFVEHDWNPTRDLQAMDRAHRIGQKKVVNVYRLITKDTLEEKIMGLQKFKTMVSNTVINQDNTGVGTMNVDQLLDLFGNQGHNIDSSTHNTDSEERHNNGKKSSFMDLLPELWDQQQYETEYDLSNFVSSLKN